MTAGTPLGVPRAVALYLGALLGPGLLFVPALAEQAAGPAAILAWAALLVLSAPLAITFGVLGVRHPVADGVAAYARAAFGVQAARVTGAWFLCAVILGGPAVALIGGYYVAELTGGHGAVAVTAALLLYAAAVGANTAGISWSTGMQLGLSFALVALVAAAILATVPGRISDHWTPFAPHGWWAVGSSAAILVWLFIGWEAMAQLAGELANPARDLPRAIALTFGVITTLYVGLAVATIVVPGTSGSRVPLAALMGAGFGQLGRDVTVIVAVTLTAGTMNVYIAAAARLTGALAAQGALPRRLASSGDRSIPREPLALLAITAAILLIALRLGVLGTTELVRATSACFVAVYVLALSAAVRSLEGPLRAIAAVALALACVVAAFSSTYLAVPAVVAIAVLATRHGAVRRRLPRARARRVSPPFRRELGEDPVPQRRPP